MTMRLTGFEAIEFAEKEGLTLNKAADSIDGEALNLTVPEAEAIADDDPDLIWLEVPENEYYGEQHNMEPGAEGTRGPRLAGQKRDELLPGQNSGRGSRDIGAAGTPGGGMASGGLAGTNEGDGSVGDVDLEDAMFSGDRDNSGDTVDTNEPQSGRTGGAIGGTPAGKRSRPR
jgi:hypothetical protein